MTQAKISTYRDQFEKLFSRTLYSYPFYDKTDEELITDAINKDPNIIEFGLFKLGERDEKTVPTRGGSADMKYIPLISLQNDAVSIDIKLSSFIFPCFHLAIGTDAKIRSTFNSKLVDSCEELYKLLDMYSNETVLVTTCWSAMSIKFFSSTTCVNIIPITESSETANIIRNCFKEERIKFINEIFITPHKYFSVGMVDQAIAKELFEEYYKEKLTTELGKLKSYIID